MRAEGGCDRAGLVPSTTLTAGGIHDVAPQVSAWVELVATDVRGRIGDGTVHMHLRAYRHHGHEHLSCDFSDEGEGAWHMMTFVVDDGLRLHETEPRVPDVTEALFLAGLLAERLYAVTLIDVAQSRAVSPV